MLHERYQAAANEAGTVLLNKQCAPGMGATLWGESPLWANRIGLIESNLNHQPRAAREGWATCLANWWRGRLASDISLVFLTEGVDIVKDGYGEIDDILCIFLGCVLI